MHNGVGSKEYSVGVLAPSKGPLDGSDEDLPVDSREPASMRFTAHVRQDAAADSREAITTTISLSKQLWSNRFKFWRLARILFGNTTA